VNSTNIALGFQAGNIINGTQSGLPNGLNSTAVGSYTGMNHTGTNNTFIGSVAGQASTSSYFSRTGNNNTYVGYAAQADNSAWANSTAIGTGATITASNQIVLGTTNETVNVSALQPYSSVANTNGKAAINIGAGTISTPGYATALKWATTTTSGWNQMIVVGSYRPTTNTWDGGMYIGIGTSDTTVNNYYIFGSDGGTITSSAATFNLATANATTLNLGSSGTAVTIPGKVQSLSGAVSLNGTFQNIFTVATNASSYILTILSNASDGTYGVYSIVYDNGDAVITVINGNNIGVVFSGTNIQVRSVNGNPYASTTWSALRLM